MMARNSEKAEKWDIRPRGGGQANLYQGGCNQSNDVENFVDKTADVFGTLDILVNNAEAGTDLQPTVNLSDEEFDLESGIFTQLFGAQDDIKNNVRKKWEELLISHLWKVNMASRW